MCVCPNKCTSCVIGALFSLPSVFVFTCSSYLMWPHRRSKSQHARGRITFSPSEGRITAPIWHDLLTVTVTELEKRKFVKRITIKYTAVAETSLALSDYSGKVRVRWRQPVVVMDAVSSIYELSLLLVRPPIPVSPWNCYWLSLQSRGSLSSINATRKYTFCFCPQAAVFSQLRGGTDYEVGLFALTFSQLQFCLLEIVFYTTNLFCQSQVW